MKYTDTVFKLKMCDYLQKSEISPCKLSYAHKLNIVNMNLCTGINKWRLNDNFLLPPFMADSIAQFSLEDDIQIELQIQESDFFEMMENPYAVSWKNESTLIIVLYSNEGSIEVSRLYSYWPNFFHIWVPFRDAMLILSGFIFKKFTKQAEARRVFILFSFVTDFALQFF